MALDLGELSGRVGLDVGPFDAGLAKVTAKLQEWGGAGGKGAKLAAGAGIAIATALAAGVVKGMELEPAKDKLSAQLGLTGAESERIGKLAGKLYAGAYGESLGEVNTAVDAVVTSIGGMRKASDKELESASAKALDFASVFEVDVARSTQVVGQLIKTGLAKDATEGFDLLTAASQKVPANLREDVLDASDEYGQFFASIGLNGQQAFSLLVNAADKGQFGIDKVGDAIKEFTIRATDGSTASKAAYKAIGLDSDEMATKVAKGGKDAAGATQQIIDGLLKIKDPAKQGQAAIALFGTPLEDLNVQEIPAFLTSLKGGQDAMKGFGGASEQMGKTLNDNASTNLESFKRQVTTAFVDFVGGKALPIVNDLTATLSTQFGPALESVGTFLVENKEAVGGVAIGVGALVTVLGVASAVTKAVATATAAWTAIQKIASVAAKAGAAGQWLLNAALSANPIGIVVLAIAALVAGLIWFFTQTELGREIVAKAMEGIQIAIGWVVEKANEVQAWFAENWPLIQEAMIAPVRAGVKFVQDHIQLMADKFNEVKEFVTGAFSLGWKTAESIIKDPIGAAKKGLDELLGKAGLRDTFNGAKDFVTGTWSKGWKGAEAVLKDPIGAGKKAVDVLLGKTGIRDTFNGAKDWVGSTWKKGWSAAESILKDPIGSGKKAIDVLLGKTGLRDTMLGVRDWIRDTWASSWAKVEDFMKDPIGNAKKAIATLLGKTGLQKVFNDAVDKVGEIWDGLKDKAKAPISFIINDVLNGGLIKAYNWIADKLPGVDPIGDIKIKGFHDGGYTGNIDPGAIAGVVHGDEQVIKSASRRTFESKFPGYLKFINENGDLPAGTPGYKDGGQVTSYKGHRFTELFVAGLKAAEKIAGESLSIFQGGFRPTTSYSGTSHAKDAIDLQVSYPLIAALRAVGIPTWDRTNKGNWAAHAHGVPLPGAGYAGGSAIWQAQDYLNGGDGLGGRDNGPRSGNLLGGIGSAIGGLKDFVAGIIDDIKSKITGPLDKLDELGGSAWAELVKAVPKSIADDVINFVKGANPIDLIGIGAYANGSGSTVAGIASVAENGPELVVGPQLRRFKQGQTVLNADETAAFMRGQLKVELTNQYYGPIGLDPDDLARRQSVRMGDQMSMLSMGGAG